MDSVSCEQIRVGHCDSKLGRPTLHPKQAQLTWKRSSLVRAYVLNVDSVSVVAVIFLPSPFMKTKRKRRKVKAK